MAKRARRAVAGVDTGLLRLRRTKRPRAIILFNKYLDPPAHQVFLVNGCQSFRFDYRGTLDDCKFYVKMLKKAGL